MSLQKIIEICNPPKVWLLWGLWLFYTSLLIGMFHLEPGLKIEVRFS